MTKYTIKHTTQFKKDYKLAKKRHLDTDLLKDIITKLANFLDCNDEKYIIMFFFKFYFKF